MKTSNRPPFHTKGKPRFGKAYDGKPFEGKPYKGKPRRDSVERRDVKLKPQPPALPTRERDSVLIWGLHAARAAWLNPKRRCFRLWLTEASTPTFEPLIAEA